MQHLILQLPLSSQHVLATRETSDSFLKFVVSARTWKNDRKNRANSPPALYTTQHYLTAETFSTGIHVHIQVSLVWLWYTEIVFFLFWKIKCQSNTPVTLVSRTFLGFRICHPLLLLLFLTILIYSFFYVHALFLAACYCLAAVIFVWFSFDFLLISDNY